MQSFYFDGFRQLHTSILVDNGFNGTNHRKFSSLKGISKNASWIVIDGESGNSLACR